MPFTAQWEIISCLIWMSNWRNWTYPVPNSCACNYFNQVRPYQISFHVAHAIMEAQRHISLHFLLLLLTEAYPDSCEVFRWLSESFVILPRLFHSNSSNRKPIICCNHILPISSSFSEKWNKEIKKRQARIIKKNEEKKNPSMFRLFLTISRWKISSRGLGRSIPPAHKSCATGS